MFQCVRNASSRDRKTKSNEQENAAATFRPNMSANFQSGIVRRTTVFLPGTFLYPETPNTLKNGCIPFSEPVKGKAKRQDTSEGKLAIAENG
jgi:hypothetical protein